MLYFYFENHFNDTSVDYVKLCLHAMKKKENSGDLQFYGSHKTYLCNTFIQFFIPFQCIDFSGVNSLSY